MLLAQGTSKMTNVHDDVITHVRWFAPFEHDYCSVVVCPNALGTSKGKTCHLLHLAHRHAPVHVAGPTGLHLL